MRTFKTFVIQIPRLRKMSLFSGMLMLMDVFFVDG